MPRKVGVWAAMPALAKRTVMGWGRGTACAAAVADGPPGPPMLGGEDGPAEPPLAGRDAAAGAGTGAAAGALGRAAQALPKRTIKPTTATSRLLIARSFRAGPAPPDA